MILDFNKIYVIQSLNEEEEDLTGTLLFGDVLQYFKEKYPDKDATLINVNTPGELISVLDDIKNDCKKGIKPIIHFEIHGLRDRTGLSLNDGDISWTDLYTKFIEINTESRWTLFITMAVCFGNYAMELIKPTKPAPFSGILGSFDALYPTDLYIKYTAFYHELLMSLNFEQALDALQNANPALPDDYRFIDAEQTFKNVYQKYFDREFTPEKAKERFEKTIKEENVIFTDRNFKQRFYSNFRAQLARTKKEFYERDKATFFMFDRFPGHKSMYCVNWEPVYNR